MSEADEVPGRAWADLCGAANAWSFCPSVLCSFNSLCQMERTEAAACSFLTTVSRMYLDL